MIVELWPNKLTFILFRSLLVYGGFVGTMMSDVIVYTSESPDESLEIHSLKTKTYKMPFSMHQKYLSTILQLSENKLCNAE